uniref:Rap-GAP domain-containing protein n=1 Tax=Strigamia maritima TaxID=126957 RepID=T1JGQ1_STRMM
MDHGWIVLVLRPKDPVCAMYYEWSSLQSTLQTEDSTPSVLNKFSSAAGKDVATAVVKHLAQNLGINTTHCDKSSLQTDKDVQWCMEVICFGLGLALSEHDTIKDCVNIYCEWLMALRTPKFCVPTPVCDEPNLYARKMIQHLYNLFKPRQDAADNISKQAVLCHRVLRILQLVALESSVITWETWETLLLFLLAVNNTLLSPPTLKDDIGDHMCERVLSVLFEIWLLACARSFPTPPLWKTFRDVCVLWRHRPALVDQWNRVNLALTSRLLKFVYGHNFPALKIPEEDAHLVPVEMSNDCVAQTWFRFLHTLHNPVDLYRSPIISQTPKFLHYAITSSFVTDPSQHPCLTVLPLVFVRAMRGIAMLTDAFLGICQTCDNPKSAANSNKLSTSQSSVTPPQQRRIAKSFSVSAASGATKGHQKSSLIGKSSQSQTIPPLSTLSSAYSSSLGCIAEPRVPLAPSRPKCNSILHLFGSWLFEAALIGSTLDNASQFDQNSKQSDSRRGSGSNSSEIRLDTSLQNNPDDYEAGRAEAIGALCRIFCAKKTGEEILPVYLARFYLALEHGLRVDQIATGQVLCSILFNSGDLLRLDLDGVQILVPHFLTALEMVLPDRELDLKIFSYISQAELRRAAINVLLSLVPLPLHFRSLPIKDITGKSGVVTFQSLRSRIVNLLFNALQCEVDSTNTQMLLAGLLVCVQDAAAIEEVEQFALQHDSGDTAVNLQCSAGSPCESFSSWSASASEFSGAAAAAAADELSSFEADFSPSYDSAHALFVRATYLVCHRLISSWKTDLNVSLAALELLSGFCKIKIHEQEAMECKRAVKWICDYIVSQCNRPPPAHSKDLHSTIVAAFQCVSSWLVEHPYLLQDKECLGTVLEVIELGISGSKSQAKHTDTPSMKGDKMCKPVSLRVRDAAEAALNYVLDQAGAFPTACGPETLSSLLDEDTLLPHCDSKQEALSRFCYCVVENSFILALLEQPLGNDQDPQPTVIVLNRGPFGRHAWAMQLRHLPRHKSGTKCYAVNPGRPLPINDMGIVHNIRQRHFPESVDRINFCKAEKSIPSLDSLLNDQQIASEHEKLSQLLDSQIAFEEKMKIQRKNDIYKTEYPNPETECRAPELCHEFQTARLFLSHFGFLSLESLRESIISSHPSLIRLDSAQNNFVNDIEILDKMSGRTYDTVFVFYVKSGQKTPQEIMANVMQRDNVSTSFMEFLLTLGWPVDVAKHPGWTGHVSTSWKVSPSCEISDSEEENHGGGRYCGHKQVLYWSDFSSEMAFVVPTAKRKENSQLNLEVGFDRSALERHSVPPVVDTIPAYLDTTKPRTLSLDLDKVAFKEQESPADARNKKFGRGNSSSSGCDTKVILVWLESFEDHANFPLIELLPETMIGNETAPNRVQEKDMFVVFIHALQNGLFRIHVQRQGNRVWAAIPLLDGMVVSRRVLGPLVRQTALNVCRRRRLENDCYQPPHMRRKFKLQEIANKYGRQMTEAEFYTSLFKNDDY